MHLAILEIECLISAMIKKVSEILVGEPTVAMNNTICAFSALPVKFKG